MTRRFTREELMAEIEKVKEMMKEVENDMDGQYELLEDHLSDLLEEADKLTLEEYLGEERFEELMEQLSKMEW